MTFKDRWREQQYQCERNWDRHQHWFWIVLITGLLAKPFIHGSELLWNNPSLPNVPDLARALPNGYDQVSVIVAMIVWIVGGLITLGFAAFGLYNFVGDIAIYTCTFYKVLTSKDKS